MSALIKRKTAGTLLLSLWAAALLLLSDAAYGGYMLKLRQYDWALPAYRWLELHIGYSLANLGFFALYLSLTLGIASLFLGLSVVLKGSFGYKLLGTIGSLLAGVCIWYIGPSWFLTACGMVMLAISPHTHTVWDRIFAIILLLFPLLAFFPYMFFTRKPKPPPPADIQNDL